MADDAVLDELMEAPFKIPQPLENFFKAGVSGNVIVVNSEGLVVRVPNVACTDALRKAQELAKQLMSASQPYREASYTTATAPRRITFFQHPNKKNKVSAGRQLQWHESETIDSVQKEIAVVVGHAFDGTGLRPHLIQSEMVWTTVQGITHTDCGDSDGARCFLSTH